MGEHSEARPQARRCQASSRVESRMAQGRWQRSGYPRTSRLRRHRARPPLTAVADVRLHSVAPGRWLAGNPPLVRVEPLVDVGLGPVFSPL
jgi:hypothetical protein